MFVQLFNAILLHDSFIDEVTSLAENISIGFNFFVIARDHMLLRIK